MATISVDRIYQSVQALVNKDQRSSLKPSEFNAFASLAMADIMDEVRITVNNDKVGLLNGTIDMERVQYSSEALRFFYVPALVTSKVGTYYPHPVDLESTDKLFFDDTLIEEAEGYYHITLLRKLGKHLSPDGEDANVNYYWLPVSGGYQVLPSIFQEDIIVSYTRKWAIPKWTYNTVLNTAVFNGSATDVQDFELSERFFDDIVLRIALYAGVNLRDIPLMNPLFDLNKIEEKENVS